MSSIKYAACCAAIAALVAVNTGCGTLMGGTKHTVRTNSTPSGVTVSVDRIGISETTPATLKIPRKENCFLTFSKDGYETKKVELKRGVRGGPIILSTLLTTGGGSLAATAAVTGGGAAAAGYAIAGVGVLGLVFDAVTGGLYGFKQNYIEVALNKTSAATDGPDEIRVSLLVEKGPDGEHRVRTTSLVPVTIVVEPVN